MQFTDERVEDGDVRRYSFNLTVAGDTVPAVLWAPNGAKGARPLVLMGHGGSQHKKTPGIVARARQYANRLGYATLAIDAPDHGDRTSREAAAAMARSVGARVRGEGPALIMDAQRLRQMGERTQKAIPEWNAALAAAQDLDFVGRSEGAGYWACRWAPRLACHSSRNAPPSAAPCSDWLAYARMRPSSKPRPTQSPSRWSLCFSGKMRSHPRAWLALFDAFGSKEKCMHVNPGGHLHIPRFEGTSWERFYERRLGIAADAQPAA